VTDVAAIAEGLARFEARGPCTDAERRAAGWLHDELRRAGWEAWVETQWVRPQSALSLALHATLGVVASVLAITAPLPALIVAGAAAASMALEATGRVGPLRWIFPRRATQNVLTVPDDDAEVALLICARYDAPRGGIGRRVVEGRERWVAGALVLVAVCAGLRLLDLEGLWLGLLQFVPTVALLLALAAAGDVAVSPFVAGGEAPPAVAVALYDELRRNPPSRLSPALLLHGGPQALRAHLRRERPQRGRIVLLELGAGPLAYASAHPQLRAAAARAGAPERVSPRGVARIRRLPSIWIGAADERALDYALACVDALDAELA
jgi:hypothetical protein